ncbi:MAG: hypothetical protein NTY09_09590 [bacterium]|nr:hypothetical protein [bacterium]
MKRSCFALLTLIFILILIGCTGGSSPVAPDSKNNIATDLRSGLAIGSGGATLTADLSDGSPLSPYASENMLDDAHRLLAIQRVRVYEDGRLEIFPLRSEQVHIDITNFIFSSPGAVGVELDPPPSGKTINLKLTLTNPTPITVYDLSAIVRYSGDIIFLNPDSYTLILCHPGDTIPNPYKAWDTGVGNRALQGYAAHAETVSFEMGSMTKFVEMDFLFECSYPANQEEPYEIRDCNVSADFQNNGLNTVDLSCKVGDWQANIDSVMIDLSPVGGSENSLMSPLGDDLYGYYGVSYGQSGQGVGDHMLKVTATSNGVSTFNYIPITVVQSTVVKQGSFEIQYQNLPLETPNGPTDGMDIAVMGAQDGTFVSMVFGDDDTYHFWRYGYTDGTTGLYHASDGSPIEPFNLPINRFDFADQNLADTTGASIFSMSWGESNTSEEIIDGDTLPNIIARQRISLWKLSDLGVKLTGNVLVNVKSEGPPKVYNFIVKPIEYASGFNQDGILFAALAFDSGDPAQFPIVEIIGLHPPLDFSENPALITDGFGMFLDEGSGPGVVNKDAIRGIDVDDTNILPVSGGYAGHAWVAVVEAGAENSLEIVDADIDLETNDFITVSLPSAPLDVQILPLKKVGQPSNVICVLCSDNLIRLYNYSGTLLDTIGGPPYMTGSALRLDIDDTNLAIHVLHQGTSSPLVTVYRWAP